MPGEITTRQPELAGATLYFTVEISGTIWGGSSFGAFDSGSWASYAQTMAESLDTPGLFVGNFPTAITAAGTYLVSIYRRLAGTPAITDPPVAAGTLDWSGSTVSPPTTPTTTATGSPSASGITPYCSIESLLDYVEEKLVGQLCRDGGDQASRAVMLDAGDPDALPTPVPPSAEYLRLTKALESASGEIESACMVGSRYSSADLAGLAGNAKALLERMTAWIALRILLGRRSRAEASEQIQWADTMLGLLRAGTRIFATEDALAGGLPDNEPITTADREAGDYLSERARRYFGHRGTGTWSW